MRCSLTCGPLLRRWVCSASNAASARLPPKSSHFAGTRTNLFSSGDRIPFIDPIRAEIIRDVEHLHVGESEGAQGVVGGLDIGTMTPWATAAIQNDELVSRQGFYSLSEELQSCVARRRADVFGA